MTFLENFRFSSINFVSFGWKVLMPALTWDKGRKEEEYCSLKNVFDFTVYNNVINIRNKLDHVHFEPYLIIDNLQHQCDGSFGCTSQVFLLQE